MRFGLSREYDVYQMFWLEGKWCPLVVISVCSLAWLIQVTLVQRLQQVGHLPDSTSSVFSLARGAVLE